MSMKLTVDHHQDKKNSREKIGFEDTPIITIEDNHGV